LVVIDDQDFRDFFTAEYGHLRRLGFLLTGDWAQADELAQESLVRTFWVWPRVRRLERPDAYTRRVLVNRHRSLLRRALVEARYATRIYQRETYLLAIDEGAMVLWAAVRALPRRERDVLVLRFYEDLAEAEVARLLRLPLGTVKSLTHRGLVRLRAKLHPGSAPERAPEKGNTR
jgi:RNA polymerase sigma-70 factor (sigma-E family)